MSPFISVIVANYNGAAFLEEALRSVLMQSFERLELLLVDDCSTDRSVEIAEGFAANDARLRIIELGSNRGPAAARNAGLRAARGAWISIVDSDDFIHPERLARLLEIAERDGADIVADDQIVFNDARPGGATRMLRGARAAQPTWITAAEYVRENHLFATGASLGYLKPLIRASLLRAHGVAYHEGLKNAEDYDLILRLLVRGARFRLVPEMLYFYRRHNMSISHRLASGALPAMAAADDDFRLWAGPEAVAPLRAALDARRASIATAQTVEDVIAQLKARRPVGALRSLSARPSAIPILARMLGPRMRPSRKGKRFFFEKKNQKTFVSFPPGDVETPRVKVTEVFCGAFLQKSDRLLSESPFVTIVVPALNEARYIESCLASLAAQCAPGRHEILVMDGGSTDSTRAIVAAFGVTHPAVALIHNPKRLQSAAVNLASRLAAPQSTIMIRADAHARYSPDFVQHCVGALLANGATSVVVPMRTVALPGAGVQRAIAAAQSSRLGNGGSAHRARAVSGFVEHGHHAGFNLPFFRALGGYDEGFTHNEDAELDVRARAAGGGVWMCAEEPVLYYPRDRLSRLAVQYFRHGGGRARTLRKHHLTPKLRQAVPLAALAGCIAGVAAAPFAPAYAAVALCYPASCLAWGVTQGIRRRDPALMFAGLALMTMHLSWAVGFVAENLRGWKLPVPSKTALRRMRAVPTLRRDATPGAERR